MNRLQQNAVYIEQILDEIVVVSFVAVVQRLGRSSKLRLRLRHCYIGTRYAPELSYHPHRLFQSFK
jgi:hypothetical protein